MRMWCTTVDIQCVQKVVLLFSIFRKSIKFHAQWMPFSFFVIYQKILNLFQIQFMLDHKNLFPFNGHSIFNPLRTKYSAEGIYAKCFKNRRAPLRDSQINGNWFETNVVLYDQHEDAINNIFGHTVCIFTFDGNTKAIYINTMVS